MWTLFVGAVLRNLLALAKLHEIDGEALAFAGSVSLSLFLAMAPMSLRLWELAALVVGMFVILALQAVDVALFTTFITFRVMGSNYEATALVGGQCGFGHAPQTFILVPVMGAFLIDIANAIVISAFAGFLPLLRQRRPRRVRGKCGMRLQTREF